MSKKYIYLWWDYNCKQHHYFSNKLTFNKWLNKFDDEFVKTKSEYNNYFYQNLKLRSRQDIKKYFSGPYYLEKIYLDV